MAMMTDQLFETFDPFNLDDGVPLDLLAGIDDRDVEASYLRVHDGMLDDDAIGDLIADCGAAGLGMWLAVLVSAKEARAFGVLSLNAMTFGGAIGATSSDVLEAVQAMSRAGLVWSRIDGRRVMLRVQRWHRWQSLTDAEVKRLERRRAKHGVAPTKRRRRNKTDDGGLDPTSSLHVNEDVNEDVKNELGVRPSAHASALVREAEPSGYVQPVNPPAVEIPVQWEPVAVELRKLFDTDRDMVAAYRALEHDWMMTRGIALDAVAYGVASVNERRAREPSWWPKQFGRYVLGAAKRHRPDLIVPTPDPKARPDDALTLKQDADLARFR